MLCLFSVVLWCVVSTFETNGRNYRQPPLLRAHRKKLWLRIVGSIRQGPAYPENGPRPSVENIQSGILLGGYSISTMKESESVWDYPRPPRLETSSEHVVVVHQGKTLVDTTKALRILETSHPPTYYLPFEDAHTEFFQEVEGSTWCEFKGQAVYADIVVGSTRIPRAMWWYPTPTAPFRQLEGYFSLYPGRVDQCTVDGEVVQAQDGDFYGGWITTRITGPFKGGPGTFGW